MNPAVLPVITGAVGLLVGNIATVALLGGKLERLIAKLEDLTSRVEGLESILPRAPQYNHHRSTDH